MGSLAHLGLIVVAIIAVGIFASACERDERLLKRFAAVLVIAIMGTLAFAVVRGDLLRYAPGTQDSEAESGSSLP